MFDSVHAAHKSMLGEMLVRKGLITREQLELALVQQANQGGKLGAVLVEMRILGERQIQRALMRQRSYRYAVALATAVAAPLTPMLAAASIEPPPVAISQTYVAAQMSDEDMAGVYGQGFEFSNAAGIRAMQDTIAQAAARRDASSKQDIDQGGGSDQGAIDGVALLKSLFQRISPLDADVTISDVQYDSDKPMYELNPDGSFEVKLPSRIGSVALKNVRVRGGDRPVMGNVYLQNISMRDSSMTVRFH